MTAGLDVAAVARLLPMHLVLGADGAVLGCGPTLRRLLGDAARLEAVMELHRPCPQAAGPAAMMRALAAAARTGERVFLRLIRPVPLVLRGHGVALLDGRLLLNLGFGPGLVEAVRAFRLSDADFAPDELAMELLFLHEANRAILAALSESGPRPAPAPALTDPLTGLANRHAFDLAMGLAVAGLAEGGDFALVHLGLDHLQPVHDRLGRKAGDLVLCRVADMLRALARPQDSVARLGGDAFALILPGLTRRPALDALLTGLIARIEQPIPTPAGTARVTASIGVALAAGGSGCGADALHRGADRALDAARRAGRGCWRLSRPAPG